MDVCAICCKPLHRCPTTWVADGKLFCSDLCCGRYLLSEYAEEVNTLDIGIPYKDPALTVRRTVHKTNGTSHMPVVSSMPDLHPMYDDTYRKILDARSTRDETIIIREES